MGDQWKCSCFQRSSWTSECCLGELGVLQGVLPRVLNVERQQEDHSREHSLEPPAIPLSTLQSTSRSTSISQSTSGSTSQSTSRDFPFSTPVTGRHHCNTSGWNSKRFEITAIFHLILGCCMPTFLRSRNLRIFILYDLLKAD